MRYLAIDHGDKHVGLAICDAAETIASPLTVLHAPADPLERIEEIVKTESVEAIVVGLPLNMDDTEGPQARLVQKFAERLQEHLDIPVHFQDERLSSFSAEEKLAPAELTKDKKRKRLDAIAAAAILEAFLEAKKAK